MRPFVLLSVMALCTAGLVARLGYWQVMQHGHLTALAAVEEDPLSIQTALRGQIFDASGNTLATDVTKYLVYAAPKQIKDPTRTASLMAPVLQMPPRALYALCTGNQTLELLGTPISSRDAQTVSRLGLPGIILNPVPRRTYPMGRTAAQVLGFTNLDLKGQYGVEGQYDRVLAGTAGLRSVLKDTSGNDIHLSSQPPSPAQNGGDLYLTIDSNVQGVVQDELNKAVKSTGSIAGTAIVMDPRTGYLLGMASTPSFDPNHYSRFSPTTFSNPAIQWMYEPGSTMKVLTMAAGLDAGAITPESALDDTGRFDAGGGTIIRNWSDTGFGYENMTQVLRHSANVGASWVAQRLGADRFYSYMKRFQLDRPTDVDLQGEETGLVPMPGTKGWSIVNLYTNSFGQGLLISPLRLLESIGAVANDGVMVQPQIVQREVYRGKVIDHPPIVAGRPITAATAHTLTTMLVNSAVDGEAALALVRGYDIAAKTGTANIADGRGSYLKNQTIASVIGYAPAKTPRFIVLVVLNRPKTSIWGSMTAAPVLHNIMRDLFSYYRVPPSPHAIYR